MAGYRIPAPAALARASIQPGLQSIGRAQGQARSQQAQQQAAIQGFSDQLVSYLRGEPAAAAGDYNHALAQQQAMAQRVTDSLKGVLPEQSQGLSSVLFGSQGAIPGTELSNQQASQLNFLRALPAIATVHGQDVLRSFLYSADQQNQKLAGQRADLIARLPGLTAQNALGEAGLGVKQQALALNQALAQSNLGLKQQTVAISRGNLKERIRSDTANQTARANKASAAQGAKRQSAFFSTRQKAFQAAQSFFKQGKASAGPAGVVPLPSSGGQVDAPTAYKRLWSQYGNPLVTRYGYKRAAVDTMILRAMVAAGYQNPKQTAAKTKAIGKAVAPVGQEIGGIFGPTGGSGIPGLG